MQLAMGVGHRNSLKAIDTGILDLEREQRGHRWLELVAELLCQPRPGGRAGAAGRQQEVARLNAARRAF